MPYSCSSSENENEICVGKRGYKKISSVKSSKSSEKEVLPNPCLIKTCRKECSRLSETSREYLNAHYWGMSQARRRTWLLSCLKPKQINRRRAARKTPNRRNNSFEYSLVYEGVAFKVCQKFILATLNISQMMLRNAVTKENLVQPKPKVVPHNKTKQHNIDLLKAYIEKLPAVPSHYCRAKSTKVYLPQEFRNIQNLYMCYTKYMEDEALSNSTVSNWVFRQIFKKEFNIGFHLPKKDKCTKCENIKYLDEDEKQKIKNTEEFKMHMKDKEMSKSLFLRDQGESKKGSKLLCASFDLQKVLNTPFGKNITLFYSRKYAYYNFSVYENGTKNGYCFLWGEQDGKRGCNEICSALYKYLLIIDQRGTADELSLYCDSCAGQNCNKAVIAVLAYFLNSSTFVHRIKITYLLPGHTMMPVDSVHSTIESFVRNRTIWAPSEWPTIIRSARTNPSGYDCIEMEHTDFKNWKSFADLLLPNKIKLKLNKLRIATFQKKTGTIELLYGYFDNSKKQTITNINFTYNIETLYHHTLCISSKKFNDLQNLCFKNSIPPKYHQEYLNLKHSSTIKDSLDESDDED